MARVRPLLYLILVTLTCLLLAPIRESPRHATYTHIRAEACLLKCDTVRNACAGRGVTLPVLCETDRDWCKREC